MNPDKKNRSTVLMKNIYEYNYLHHIKLFRNNKDNYLSTYERVSNATLLTYLLICQIIINETLLFPTFQLSITETVMSKIFLGIYLPMLAHTKYIALANKTNFKQV